MAATASLAVRVSAQIAEFQAAFKETSKSLDKFHNEFENTATRAAAVGTFFGNVFSSLASSIARGMGSAISEAIRLSSEFQNAFLGLGSIATAFGQDVEQVKDSAKSLSADGLLPLKDSATGLKNLLAAGFNLEQANKLMLAFKDSAAFGRQSALSFGDAVRSATEGVKNGNSAVVDNAGVTKNLSIILKEAGFRAEDLGRASTDAAVRMALFKGILKETAAQTGDAAKLSETYTGQITKLETAWDSTLASLGDAITKNATVAKVIGQVSDQVQRLNGLLGDNKKGYLAVSDGIIATVKAGATLIGWIDLVQTGFAGLQITANTVFQGFASGALLIAETTARLSGTMKFLDPKNWAAWEGAGRDAAGMVDFLKGAVEGFDRASIDAQNRSIEWGNKLQGIKAQIEAYAKELEATRGKTVELGNTSGKTGNQIATGLGGGVGKADKELEKLQARLSGAAILADAKQWSQAFKNIGSDLSKLTKKDLKEFSGILNETADRFGSLETAGIGALNNLKIALDALQAKGQPIEIPVVPTISTRTLAHIFAVAKPPEMILPITPVLGEETMHHIELRAQNAGEVVETAFGRLKKTLGDIGIDAATQFTTALADGFRTGDWASVRQAVATIGAQAISAGLSAALDVAIPGAGRVAEPLFNSFFDTVFEELGWGRRGHPTR